MQKPVMLLRALTLFPLLPPLAPAVLPDAQLIVLPQLTMVEGEIVYARAPLKS
jgi:hypothetical protein